MTVAPQIRPAAVLSVHPADLQKGTRTVAPTPETLLAFLSEVARAASTGAALELAYAFLHSHYGVRALAVEFEAGGGTRFQSLYRILTAHRKSDCAEITSM